MFKTFYYLVSTKSIFISGSLRSHTTLDFMAQFKFVFVTLADESANKKSLKKINCNQYVVYFVEKSIIIKRMPNYLAVTAFG